VTAPWIGPGVVATLWGIGSASLVVEGWRAYSNAFIGVAALVRGRTTGSRTFGTLVGAVITGLVCSGLLRGGFWWLVEVLGFGRTPLEQIVYCTSLGIALRYMLPWLGSKIRISWRTAMDAPLPAEGAAAVKPEGR
jgi:hypothetical protein